MVNSMHGQIAALKAAFTQGGYSFLLTFFMTMGIESVYRMANIQIGHPRLVKLLTVSVVCVFLYVSSWWVNVMAGTPEIFSTVILGYIVGTLYTALYVQGLSKLTPV